MLLSERTAIVTGAAQGLGLAIARRFVAEGALVVMADVNGAKLDREAARLRASGAAPISIAADVTVKADVDGIVAAALRRFGRIDALVNNAGGSGSEHATEIEDVSEEMFDRVVALNLKSTFLCCQAVSPAMKARRYGRIVNFSSGIARGFGRSQATGGAVLPYASAKAGILGLTSALAKQMAPYDILVNAVVPGFMLTEEGTRVRSWYDGLDDRARQALDARNAVGRPGSPEEVADLVAFLSSDRCGYVAGAAIDINGAG